MHFSEDDLRTALKRKDPGEGFTRRLMARVEQKKSQSAVSRPGPNFLAWLSPLRLRPALAMAVAFLVLLAGAWIGFQQHERHVEEARLAKLQEDATARRAEEQAILALRITSAKLKLVFQKVNGSQPHDMKIRRQSL